MSAMTAMRILYPQLVWLPSNAAPEGDANQHGNKLRATDEQQNRLAKRCRWFHHRVPQFLQRIRE